MRRVIPLLMFLVCVACHRSEPAAEPRTSEEHAAAHPGEPTLGEPTLGEPTAGRPLPPLPRAVGGVTLGMSTAEAEQQLGALTCHDNERGFRVCSGTKDPGEGISHLEVYINHDHVISLAYDGALPPNAWDFLDGLIQHYGSPSLSGRRERDKSGRLHEIYGWKDPDSLYSVRLIWRDTEAGGRDLIGTSIALWDRKGYQQWEDEAKQRAASATPTVPPDASEKT